MARKKVAPEPPAGPFGFSFDAFEEWYERATAEFLEPSRLTFVRILNEALDAELSDLDRYRIRVSSSRVKDAVRLWSKLLRPKYSGQLEGLDSIPNVVDDLVGVRITCNNLKDVETLQEILASLPFEDETMSTGLTLEPESESKYYLTPKASGYRAYHINLRTRIPAMNGWRPARGELQVRTLLQDSWGELTHEDTYKPGAEMPPLVNNLARRMADLLATVDDLAQDLRNELDKLAEEAVEEKSFDASAKADVKRGQHEDAANASLDTELDVREALISETRRVVDGLTKPATLAEVAQQIQSNFGREITFSWGGYKSFKALLRSAVPEAVINETPPGVLIPAGTTIPSTPYQVQDPKFDDDVPPLIIRLRSYDRNVPAVGRGGVRELLEDVEHLLTHEVWDLLNIESGPVGLRELNTLSKKGRDDAQERGSSITRSALDYALKALYFSGNLRVDLGRSDIANILGAWFYSRAALFGLIDDSARARGELSEWLD